MVPPAGVPASPPILPPNAGSGASKQPLLEREGHRARIVVSSCVTRRATRFIMPTTASPAEVAAPVREVVHPYPYTIGRIRLNRYLHHLALYAQSLRTNTLPKRVTVLLKPPRMAASLSGWPAMKKLLYVDELMSEIGQRTPPVANRRTVEPLHRLPKTLAEHYAARRKKYTVRLPNIYDADLRRLFSDQRRHRRLEMASTFLRRNRGEIRRPRGKVDGRVSVTRSICVRRMIARCRVLKLHAAVRSGSC